MKNVSANKSLKLIAHFVYNIVSYVLYKEGVRENENIPYNEENSAIDAAPSSNITNDETPRSIHREIGDFTIDKSKSPLI